jgi:hypothetical protein
MRFPQSAALSALILVKPIGSAGSIIQEAEPICGKYLNKIAIGPVREDSVDVT